MSGEVFSRLWRLGALLFGAYGWQPAQAEFRSPYLAATGSRYADTPMARFHYIKAGSGAPLILISPGGSTVIGWKEQADVLAREHTVYAVDLPGQGHAQVKDPDFGYDLDAMTTAIGSFMDCPRVRCTSWTAAATRPGSIVRTRSTATSRPSSPPHPDPFGEPTGQGPHPWTFYCADCA
ncbi:alpha/beta fold hydrolase [Nonomuraea spiralis]|uniref:alpha/beta fold hydrolase n=1 Tax=Nonomuraea spiralis TaxID=46182 RepID=UPI0037B97D5D